MIGDGTEKSGVEEERCVAKTGSNMSSSRVVLNRVLEERDILS